MRRAVLVATIAILVLPVAVLAAGSGGGGSGAATVTACAQDEWTCGEWGSCELNGQQTRTCAKSFDCPNTDSPPAPPSVRSCTPTCTEDDWTCGAWSQCVNGRQQRICAKVADCPIVETPSPATESACRLDCGNDIWACTAWSACSAAGVRTRACTQRAGCEIPDAPSPKPREQESCVPTRRTAPTSVMRPRTITPALVPAPTLVPASQLACGNLATLAERVRCRLGLSSDALTQEYTIQYLPEECRAMPEGDARSACVERYRNLRPCWAKPIGAERLACVRGVLGLGGLREERARCDSKIGADQVRCLVELRAKAYPYITFRFYDLEERAEGLLRLGAPLGIVAPFVTAAEQGKLDFNAARTKEERVAIVRRVQFDWQMFVRTIPEEVRAAARTQGIGSSYE